MVIIIAVLLLAVLSLALDDCAVDHGGVELDPGRSQHEVDVFVVPETPELEHAL